MSAFSTVFFSMSMAIALAGCAGKENHIPGKLPGDTANKTATVGDTIKGISGKITRATDDKEIPFNTVQPDSLVAFAKTLVGIPYLYASTDRLKGFDCSGFITYVFNHFNMVVPRSSVDFTHIGKEVVIEKAKPGDLILFTGTDSSDLVVGHMGIVESINDDTLRFIHSTSGNAKGVVISPLGDQYKKRFVKVIRVFRDEFFN